MGLLAWLASVAPARNAVWDCGTGSGQAAIALKTHFRHVVATDPSVAQLQSATSHDGVSYAAMTAERSALRAGSVDLATVAQALHWFRRDEFFAEARRVLVDDGVLAVWNYKLLSIDPALDEIIGKFYTTEVGPYWPAERALVDAGYSQLDFPFHELEVPAFTMEVDWTLAQFAGYVGTWSAVTRYTKSTGIDPVPGLLANLAGLWGDPATPRTIRWPLEVRAGVA